MNRTEVQVIEKALDLIREYGWVKVGKVKEQTPTGVEIKHPEIVYYRSPEEVEAYRDQRAKFWRVHPWGDLSSMEVGLGAIMPAGEGEVGTKRFTLWGALRKGASRPGSVTATVMRGVGNKVAEEASQRWGIERGQPLFSVKNDSPWRTHNEDVIAKVGDVAQAQDEIEEFLETLL